MKVAGIIINIFFPGVGTLIVGKIVQGIIQIILIFVAILLTITGIGAIIGLPIYFIVWIWGIISAATAIDRSSRR
ncbi:MAG TPA: hypothetical protein DDW76_22070 [Cyanobacteria bacterium UBA11369]|nr:hypothetical protein [Cyanobacteria bacterium UBA11371]HBE36888.1 hypothetical protein [Cyanobacteria bacterium UBA11368]HBE51386.1 hypothetical protein [Cyanobacteria bacterium UBA11369]